MPPHKIIHNVLLSGALLVQVSCSTNAPVEAPPAESNATIKIGGSAETYEILERLVEAYQAKTDDIEFNFFPPSQTSGGIQGIKNDILDIGSVSRVLTVDDTGIQMTYLTLAETPLVFVAHESVSDVDNISTGEIQGIYRGDIKNWQELGGPDAPIVLFDFTEDENEKKVLRQVYLGDELEITPDAIIFAEDDELLETASTTAFSIAAVPQTNELEELPMTVLSVDGVVPSMENLQSGDYAAILPLGIIISKQASTATQAFIEFATSSEGQQVLNDSGYVVVDAME